MKNTPLTQKLSGLFIPPICAVAIVGITKFGLAEFAAEGSSPVFIFSEFVIVPILMGILSAWFWRKLNLTGTDRTLYSIYTIVLTILLCYIFLQEGIICLAIVSPLIFAFVFAGIFIGKAMFSKNNNTLNVSVVAMLLFIFMGDALSKHEYENEVTDTMIVHATPAQIWKNVVAFKRIEKKPGYWLFRMGLPSPVESTVDGYYVGAGRKCIFSNGYTFGEKIAVYNENKDLTFDITDQPRDPEIMNHLDLVRGQFLLKDNGDGTTTLTGNSWYKLYVFPTWYYDSWAQSIVRNVHVRVMEHIKELSENTGAKN